MALRNGNSYDDTHRSWLSSSPVNQEYHYPAQNYVPLYDQRSGPDYPMVHYPNYHHHHPYYPLQRYEEAPSSPPAYMTTTIGPNDVLCGRGGATNSNSGNKAFRRLVMTHKDEYLNAKKKDKPAVAARVVDSVRNQGGHFLRQHSQDGRHIYWIDVGDDRAKEKTCQALREGAPAILRQKRSVKGTTKVDSSFDNEEAPTTSQPEKDKIQEPPKPHSEKPMISATDTSSWESSSCSMDNTFLRPLERFLLPLGWDCEPIPLHRLHPTERELYLRSFLPPAHKKPRLLEYE